jgi:hypothetical protein
MLAIQPATRSSGEEKLAAVGVGAGISHRKQSWNIVFMLEILVREFATVDAFAAGAIVIGEVAALAHELWDDAVEGAGFVSKTMLARTERAKILRRLRHIAEQLELNAARGFVCDGDFEEAAKGRLWGCSCCCR